MLQANLKLFRKYVTKVESMRLNGCGCILEVMCFTILATYLEAVRSYFVGVFAMQYVQLSTAFLRIDLLGGSRPAFFVTVSTAIAPV